MNGMVDSIYFFFLFVMINNNNNKCVGKGGLLYTYDAPNKPVLYCVCARSYPCDILILLEKKKEISSFSPLCCCWLLTSSFILANIKNVESKSPLKIHSLRSPLFNHY